MQPTEETEDQIERELRDLKLADRNLNRTVRQLLEDKQDKREKTKLYLEDFLASSDADVAIEAALEIASERRLTSIVIPEGRHTLHKPIQLADGISLEGCGMGTTELVFDVRTFASRFSLTNHPADRCQPMIFKEGGGNIRDFSISLTDIGASGICVMPDDRKLVTIENVELSGSNSTYAHAAIYSKPGETVRSLTLSNVRIDGWKIGVCLSGHMCRVSTICSNCNTGVMLYESDMCIDDSIVTSCNVALYSSPMVIQANGVYDGEVVIQRNGEKAQSDVGIFKVGELFL